MKWTNLKLFRCPKCDNRLSILKRGYECLHVSEGEPCNFFVTKDRLNELLERVRNAKSQRSV